MGEDQKIRIGVGAINDFDQLQDAVGQLTRTNANLGDLVVLTQPGSLCERLLKAAQLEDGRDTGPLSIVVVQKRNDRVPPVRLSAQHGGNTALMELAAKFEDWIDGHLAGRLNRALSDGACLLFVQIAELDLEAAASIALLSHAVGGIQLHDVKIPQ